MKYIAFIALMFSLNVQATPYYFQPKLSGGQLGWGGEGFYVDIPISETYQGCSITNQLVIKSADPNYKESVAVALSIIAVGLGSRITVDGCFNNRPRVIGMGLSAG